MIILVLLSFLWAEDKEDLKEGLELKSPIAKERQDGYNLPQSSFSDRPSVESWFVKEKGFETSKNVKRKQIERKRIPAAKRKYLQKKRLEKRKRLLEKKRRLQKRRLK